MAGKRKQRAPQSTLYSPTERAAEEERRQAARLPALAVYADLAPAADSGTGDLPAISTPEHWAEAVVVSHTTAEPHDGGSEEHRGPKRSRTSDDGEVDAVDERERERQRWSAWLAAFIKDSPEPVTAMFRARATAAALAFPDRHISSFAARVAAAALPFLERHAGGSSGGAFDSLRSPPLSLPLNLPAATSTPLFAFFAEATFLTSKENEGPPSRAIKRRLRTKDVQRVARHLRRDFR